MLKHLVHMLRTDLSVRLKDMAEKQVPVKLKPIVGVSTYRGCGEGEVALAPSTIHSIPSRKQFGHLSINLVGGGKATEVF